MEAARHPFPVSSTALHYRRIKSESQGVPARSRDSLDNSTARLNGIIKEHSYENRPLVVLPQAFESERHRRDLEPLLQDPAALQKLTVVYLPPGQKGWIQLFFVRGDGSLILQAHPDRPMAITDIPTCRTKVDQDVVKNLVQLIIQDISSSYPRSISSFCTWHKVTRNWNCTPSQLPTV
jgi:hypothetical protein